MRNVSEFTYEESSVHYRTVEVNGVDVFYREAGPADAPADRAAARLSDARRTCFAT